MYCPNCNKEYEGKFCPECGTKLIVKPSASGFIVEGSGNSIDCHHTTQTITHDNSTRHDSHNDNSQHYDQRGMIQAGTYYAAQKTELELFQEKKALYLTECKRAYEDNVLEQHEVVALEEYRIKIGLDKATADSILESVRIMTERNARKTSLNPIAKTKLKILTDNLMKNEVKALMDQIDGLEALVNKFEHDELSRKYFLVLAALKPEKCIDLKENSKTDSYWKSFWSYLAYICVGRSAEAENILMSLDRFEGYPEDNITVLAVAGALMNGNKAEAKEYLDSVTGEYTTALQRFVDSLYLLLDPEMAKEMGIDKDSCAFYLVNFFNNNDSNNKSEEQECTIPYSIDEESGTFTGIVANGLPVKGIFKADSGNTFDGEFIEGKPFKGICTFADGGTFEGEFKDGNPYNGSLTDMVVDEGATITVKVVEGEFNGYGRMSFAEGGSFEGEFKDGKPFNGICNDFVSEGVVLTGRFVNAELAGYGSMRLEDGSRFEGEFKDGQPWNGKMFDMVMDDGHKVDAKISEGETQIDDETIWDLIEQSSSDIPDDEATVQNLSSIVVPEDEEDTPEKECTIAYSYANLSGTFSGIVDDGKPVKGIATFDEGGTFEGEFKDCIPFKGVITDMPYDEDSTITVTVIDGQPKDGVIKYADGHRFEGELDDGEPYNGMMFNYIMKDGSVVDSKVINGKIQAVEEAKRKAEEEARIKAEQEALRKKITYSLTVTSVMDEFQAMMTARKAFGWNVAEYREQMTQFPVVVYTSRNLKEVQDLESSLINGGYEVQLSAKNALGEDVDLTKSSKKTPKKEVQDKMNKNADSCVLHHQTMEYIDLGLSVKWATCNLGASKPEEFGDYFAWGEIQKMNIEESHDYKHLVKGKGLMKYNTKDTYGDVVDNIKQLDPSDDAATCILGNGWRMPTNKEFEELSKNCSVSHTSINGIKGLKYKSKIKGFTDKWIFLPKAGCIHGDKVIFKDQCNYWSSTLYTRRPDQACCFPMNPVTEGREDRVHGLLIRAVTK